MSNIDMTKLVTADQRQIALIVDGKARVLAEARSLRTKLFGVLDGLQVSAVVTGNTADAQAIETFKEGARDITAIDLSAALTEQAMRDAVNLEYKTMVAAAPLAVKIAFSQALQ